MPWPTGRDSRRWSGYLLPSELALRRICSLGCTIVTEHGGINDSTFPRRIPFRRSNSIKPNSAFLTVQLSSKDDTQPARADIFVRWGGSGPVVVLLHGYAEPVMAVGGEKSFGALQAVIMRHIAINVQEEVVAGSGHWLMEETDSHSRADS